LLVYSSRDLKQEILFTDVLTLESNGSTQKRCSYPHTKEHEKVPLISLQEKYMRSYMETYQNCMQQTTEYKHADGSGASPIAERYRKNKLNRQFF